MSDAAGVQLTSVLRCPECGHEERLTMPTDACLFFHSCTGCGVRLRPQAGHCCVFCSYGSVVCPPMQLGVDCCAPAEPAARLHSVGRSGS